MKDGIELLLHKCVLDEFFEDKMVDDDKVLYYHVLDMTKYDIKVVQAVMKYLYYDKIIDILDFNANQIVDILELVHEYNIKSLEELILGDIDTMEVFQDKQNIILTLYELSISKSISKLQTLIEEHIIKNLKEPYLVGCYDNNGPNENGRPSNHVSKTCCKHKHLDVIKNRFQNDEIDLRYCGQILCINYTNENMPPKDNCYVSFCCAHGSNKSTHYDFIVDLFNKLPNEIQLKMFRKINQI